MISRSEKSLDRPPVGLPLRGVRHTGQRDGPLFIGLLIELARKSRVAEWDGDLHARIASALALDEERREQAAEREERRRRNNFEGIDTRARR